jgi:serine/threonine-protein kinase
MYRGGDTFLLVVNAIGQLIDGRYEIQAVFAPGGQGDVYQVLDHHENDVYVLKLLDPNILVGNVWQEAQILRQLRDDHILEIRNAAITLGRPYIVTALARHGTLETALAATHDAGLPVDNVVTWMRQAAMGIARAHDASLVHNDLKPGNLFLTANQECLVGDFGMASLLPIGQTSAPPRGATAETAAPEVAGTWGTNAPSASIASDVYSLGATAYWLLAARPPVDLTGVHANARMRMAAASQPPRLRDLAPHVQQSVAAVIEKAIARDAAHRYATITEFAAALGSRPAVVRKWKRTDEHAGHMGCWRGERVGASTYVLCVEPGATAGSCAVVTRHLLSNARVPNGARACRVRNWPQAVRAVIRALS